MVEQAAGELRSSTTKTRVLITVILVVAVFLGGYWNIRNWIVAGNPFYPYGVMVAGNEVVDGPIGYSHIDTNRMWGNLVNIYDKLGDWQDPIRPDLPNTTGWGWFAYVLGVPTLVWTLLHKRDIRVLLVGFTLSLLLIMLSTRPGPWNMRYVVWIPALFSFSFAVVWEEAGRGDSRWFRRWLTLAFVGTTSLNFLMTINYNKVSAEEFREMLALPLWQRHSAVFTDNMPVSYADAVAYVPESEVLGYNVHSNGFVYPLYRAGLSQRITYIPVDAMESCDAIAETMRARSARYLLLAPVHTPDEIIAKLELCAAEGDPIRERGRGLYVLR